MTTSSGFLDHLSDLLVALGPVKPRRMFGGAGLYLDGVMFGLVADDILYLKADKKTQERYEAEGLEPFTYEGKSKPVRMSYWRVPDRLFDDQDEFVEWAGVALKVAREAKSKQKKSSRKRKVSASGSRSGRTRS